ncbi:hypothetical protein BH09BAC2_BH09BAC2_23090 [soil metagenome]
MKKILIIILAIFSVKDINAQAVTTLIVNPRPTAVLSEWAYRREVINYIIQSDVLPPFKIKTEIKTTDGSVIGYTDLARSQTYTVNPATGTTIFYGLDVVPLEFMIFSGKYKASLDRTGKLPADTYQICVQLVSATEFIPLTDIKCKNFFVASVQLPVLMMPANNTTLDMHKAQTAITFRWTPVTPPQSALVTYRLQVFEILENQQKLQALRGNQPILDINLRMQTQYIWRPGIAFTTDSLPKKFIWTIQTLDSNNEPLVQTDGNGESRSEPNIFTIGINTSLENRQNNRTYKPELSNAFKVQLKKSNSRDSAGYKILITNNYSGKDINLQPKSFRITVRNDSINAFTETSSNGLTRVPGKVPPHSIDLTWTNKSGYISNGETDLGKIIFGKPLSNPAYVIYEWLNNEGEVIFKTTYYLLIKRK